jgi:S-adenosylmethionine:tRNA ribosyltransferase-isomerase
MRTEDRPPPPELPVGAMLHFGGLQATVANRSELSPRLVELRFSCGGASLWRALYQYGRPVQYAYLQRDIELWSVQTTFASRPWAVEMPSAGRALSWRILLDLRRRGIELATVTHAAGLSATGDQALDEALPLAERFCIPAATVDAVERARLTGRRIIAVGTTVVRALEGCAVLHDGRLRAGDGQTELRIDDGYALRIIDGLLTGMHEPTESHYRLLQAFAPRRVLGQALAHAIDVGYRTHEFGDVSLFVPRLRSNKGARWHDVMPPDARAPDPDPVDPG